MGKCNAVTVVSIRLPVSILSKNSNKIDPVSLCLLCVSRRDCFLLKPHLRPGFIRPYNSGTETDDDFHCTFDQHAVGGEYALVEKDIIFQSDAYISAK